MKEILAEDIELAVEELKLNAKKKYDGKIYQIWELSDKDFDTINKATWKDEYGMCRWTDKGSILSNVSEITVKGQIMQGFVDDYDEYKEWDTDSYPNLLEYMCEELGVSQPRNIIAIAFDLAKLNNMSIGELFNKYQG